MKKILIIEDEQEIREKLVTILTHEGYETLATENGEKGILSSFDFNPDLILCDIMLPGLDGYEVFSEINYIPKLTMTPFVFVTAKTDKLDARKAMHLGAADYITKPFEIDDLLLTVKTQIAKKDEITQRIQDEKIRLLGKLEKEILDKEQEIERLKNLKSISEDTLDLPKVASTEKKSPKTNTNILLIVGNRLIRLRFVSGIRKNFTSNLIEVDTLQEAFLESENKQIDYIILESNPPLAKPVLMIQQIRRKPNLMHCPILISAENMDKDTLTDLAKFGNIDFILSPFNLEKLNSKISKYVK